MICWQSRGKQIRGRMLSVLWLSPMVLTISTFQVTRCRRNHLWWAPGTCLNSLALLERAVLVNYFVKNKGASVMDPKLVPPQSLHVEILTPDVMALGAPSEGDSGHEKEALGNRSLCEQLSLLSAPWGCTEKTPASPRQNGICPHLDLGLSSL